MISDLLALLHRLQKDQRKTLSIGTEIEVWPYWSRVVVASLIPVWAVTFFRYVSYSTLPYFNFWLWCELPYPINYYKVWIYTRKVYMKDPYELSEDDYYHMSLLREKNHRGQRILNRITKSLFCRQWTYTYSPFCSKLGQKISTL